MRHFLLRLLCIALAAGPCWATDFFVHPDGDDAASGRLAEDAFRTLRHAAKVLQPGDVLTLLPGEYLEQADLDQLSGSPGSPITIRAHRAGFSIMTAGVVLRQFDADAEMPAVLATRPAMPVEALFDARDDRAMVRVADTADVTRSAGSWHYSADGVLRVRPHAGQEAPAFEATMLPGPGLRLRRSRHINIEGLTFRGFATRHTDAAALVDGCSNVTFRDCRFERSRIAAVVHQGDQVRFSDCRFDAIDPTTAQLDVVGTARLLVSGCVFNGAGMLIRDKAYTPRFADNIIRNAIDGLRVESFAGVLEIAGNVFHGCAEASIRLPDIIESAHITRNTLVQRTQPIEGKLRGLLGNSNLLIDSPADADAHFCSPEQLDFRLQSDSPYRGRGEHGSDPGAHQYAGNVLFISPEGDDANDGLSVSSALRSLAAAGRLARPGVTVYLLPGEYAGSIFTTGNGEPGQPIVFRGRMEAEAQATIRATTTAVNLENRRHVTVENLTLLGAQVGIATLRSSDIRVADVRVVSPAVCGVAVVESSDVTVSRVTVVDAVAPAVIVQGDCREVAIVDCDLGSRESSLGIEVGGDSSVFLSGNRYRPGAGKPEVVERGTATVSP
jgi:hypothetical protein